jgi:SAM-dependent methyltransferase
VISPGGDWASYDEVAFTYDAVAVPHYFRIPAERLISVLGVSPSDDLLDVGAGTGAVAGVSLSFAHRVFATDLSCGMLRGATRRGVARCVASALPALPFAAGTFHGVTASFVLSHLARPADAVREMARLLRPGGRLGLTSWALGPSDGEAGLAWSEVAREFAQAATLAAEIGRALPGEEALKDLGAVEELLTGAGLAVRHRERFRFPISISTADYLRSRAAALTSRFLKRTLAPEAWRLFEARVGTRLLERFGERLSLVSEVNLAVGARS